MSIRTTIKSAGLALILVLSASVATAADNVSDDFVKIGVLTDHSGPYASLSGKWTDAAVQMAISDFGGKVLGKPIKMVVADHQNKPSVGSTIARKWVDLDGVDMIVGLNNSAVGLAVQNVASQKQTITMNVGGGSLQFTEQQCTEYGISYAYSTHALAKGTATAVVNNGGSSWFIIGADYTFGHSLAEQTTEVVERLGGEVLGSAFLPLSTTDFASALVKAQASGAEVIAFANAGNDTVNALKQSRAFHIADRGQKVVSLLMFINIIKALGLETAQGLKFTQSFYWNRNEQTREWSMRYAEQTGRMPNFSQAGAYAAVTTYLKAVEKAGTDDGKKVREVLGRMTIDNMFAEHGSILPNGRMVHDMYLLEAKKPSESQGPWDLLKVAATIPGNQAFIPLSNSACPLVQQ